MSTTQGRAPRRPTDREWERCNRDRDCAGIVLPEAHGACLQHAETTAATAALTRMLHDRAYDLRGTYLTADAFRQILTAPHQHAVDLASGDNVDLASLTEVCWDLSDCTITEPVDLADARVPAGHLDFSGARFEHMVDFSRAWILARLVCEGAVFTREAKFTETQFKGPTSFVSTAFFDGADFTSAAFKATVSFASVRVNGELAFPGAIFTARTDFDLVQGNRLGLPNKRARLDLSDTVFEQRGSADLSTDVMCDGARFEAGMDLRLSSGCYASLRGARFGTVSTVTGVGRVDLDTRRSGARDDPPLLPGMQRLTVSGPRLGPPLLLSLQETDLEKLSLADVDLSHCLFAGAHNLDKLRLDGPIRFASLPPRGFRTARNWPVVWRWSRREVIREEYLWRMSRVNPAYSLFRYWAQQFELADAAPRTGPARRVELITGERLAALYRSLRKAREDTKDEPGAGDFYYGEQEARRGSRSTRPHERWLLTAYWALSGYGQRASRALAALVVLLGTLTILLTGYGLADTAPIQRMTGTIQPAPPGPPQVITFDVTGQRGTATIPPVPAGTQPITLDVATTAPTLPPPGQRWTASRAQRAVRTLVTSLVPIATDQRLTTTGAYLVLIGRVLGVFLLGLAVLAIRARVKR